ncbi:MAG: Hpt domain-containing protein [Sulfurimonas sp.]|nr:Hpt domain-containing protein [Sulfurimonas sp.]
MLIYNFQKEFLGIDEKDLKILGFKDLAELRTEVTDFADLFVKTPGFVHNFKHVHWIDFITCAESSEESKVIINVNNKNYKCVLQITTAFLVDSPSSKAYIINLNNLRELNSSESECISGDIITRELPKTIVESKKIFNTPELSDEFDINNIEEELQSNPIIKEDSYETPIELDINFEDDLSIPTEVEPQELHISEMETVKENFDNGYIYDPKVASDELALPLDLIEEFIQDFIGQAKEFKTDLYKALDEQDLDTLRILSHKLKGVAANLRVEDALETLTNVNTSDDLNSIEDNLHTFYKIISKLAGEEISVEKEMPTPSIPNVIQEPKMELKEEILDISFKDELYSDPVETPQEALESLEIKLDEEFKEVEKTVESTIVYSKENIANEIGIDAQNFNELFDDYIKEADKLNKSIQSAIENDDLQACKNSALKLKGMSDNMRLTTFSTDLESIIHASNTQDIQNNLNNIVTAIAELSN